MHGEIVSLLNQAYVKCMFVSPGTRIEKIPANPDLLGSIYSCMQTPGNVCIQLRTEVSNVRAYITALDNV